MKTFTTNTNIAPICNVSTYEGPFSYESLWQNDEEAEREEGRLVCDDYNKSAMGERIVKEANRVFGRDKPLKDYGVVSIKATKFGSPREYNFMTDWLDLEVEVDDTFFAKAKKAILDPANRKAVVKYAGDNWVSRDGFASSMLDRISTLSRDAWKAKHYGTRMATDEDVEKALVADMDDVFGALENDTSKDAFREFGAVLALLWLIEYPSDFDPDVGSVYGSWVTDEMVEHLRGNSSLSEFCTVLDKDDLENRFGEHLFDSEDWIREFDKDGEKYLACEFADNVRTKKLWDEYRKLVLEALGNVDREQCDIIRRYATSDKQRDDEINELLDGFREDKVKEYLGTESLGILWGRATRELSRKTKGTMNEKL